MRADPGGVFLRDPVRRWARFLMVVAALGVAFDSREASAQLKTPVKIGVLTESWGPTPATIGLRDGLQALGYREDQHFHIGVRFTQGDVETFPAAVRDLLDAGADLIFATTASAAIAAQQVATAKPIVFAEVVGDPVKLGLVRSFARPGANITGVTSLVVELASKRLELFKELVPGLKRILFAYDARDPVSVAAAEVHRDAARRLGLVLVERTPRTQEEARQVIGRARRPEVDGILSPPAGPALNIQGAILDVAARHQLPTMFIAAYWVEQGALASYGPDLYQSGRQAARLVAKIMAGEPPASIPVEMNSRIEFALNLRVAKELKLQPAAIVLQRADRLIE